MSLPSSMADFVPYDRLMQKVYSWISHDVTAAMLVSPNNEMAAMLVSRSNPLGIESYYYANVFFRFRWKTWLLITWVKPKNALVTRPLSQICSRTRQNHRCGDGTGNHDQRNGQKCMPHVKDEFFLLLKTGVLKELLLQRQRQKAVILLVKRTKMTVQI